jgi:hypothetical protein
MLKKTIKQKCNWLRKLLSENNRPIINIIEECDINIWQEREIYWIDKIKPFCNHKRVVMEHPIYHRQKPQKWYYN